MHQNEDPVWLELRHQAQKSHDREPALASLLKSVILDQTSLEAALSSRLSRKLAYHATPEGYLKEVFIQAFSEDPSIGVKVRQDIRAVCERDPAAAGSSLSPFLFFKGFQALSCHRVAHWLWLQQRYDLALYLQSLISEVLAVDIHPAAQIGGGILLDHATGFVAGETSVIDDNVSILHEVTLGGTGKVAGDRHPKIRSGVLIGAGAKILGNIEVGVGSKIGAGSVVLAPVPSYTTVAGVPATIVSRGDSAAPARDMDHQL